MRDRIDYRSNAAERRRLSMYLQAGRFRKAAVERSLDDSVRIARIIFYCIAGAVFCTGTFFIFF